MEQKITFFDSLVFILPGGLFLSGSLLLFGDLIINTSYLIIEQFSLFLQCILLLFSYIVGFSFSTLMDFLEQSTGNNNLFWRTSWVTSVLNKRIKPEKRELIKAELTQNNIDENSSSFQIQYFAKMHKEVCQDQLVKKNLHILHSQSLMLRNCSLVFLFLAVMTGFRMCYLCYGWQPIVITEVVLLLLSICCFGMACIRKKVIIRTILWQYALKLPSE